MTVVRIHIQRLVCCRGLLSPARRRLLQPGAPPEEAAQPGGDGPVRPDARPALLPL
jgi:hypothetical protein